MYVSLALSRVVGSISLGCCHPLPNDQHGDPSYEPPHQMRKGDTLDQRNTERPRQLFHSRETPTVASKHPPLQVCAKPAHFFGPKLRQE